MGRMMAAVLLGLSDRVGVSSRHRQELGITVAKREGVYKGRKPGTTKKPQPAYAS